MDINQRPIVGKNYRIIKHKKGPSFGTVDLLVELIPRTPPTPEKFQRKARLRRLFQQLTQTITITSEECNAAVKRVEADYKERR